ncbi:MAG TPA: caspase family protein [Pyrinomonadaceae bacterium]|nr:caspase family protein [Pyrinomonadaceae bacterium]
MTMRVIKALIIAATLSIFGNKVVTERALAQAPDRQLERSTSSVKVLPAKAKRWALIVGVDQYRDGQINSLNGSANDAKALANALITYAGFPADQVIVLSTDKTEDRQPTRINILTYLSNLASLVPKDGLFLFSFAGHGIERSGQAFLIPSDARLSRDISLLEESAVSVTRMHDRIRAIGVGQVIVLLDACRNDPGGRAGAANNMSAAYTKFNFDVRNREVEAFATLYATAVGQRAYEYIEKKQGYFTWAIVEALKGGAANDKGEVTLSALLRYVQENVPKRIAIDLGATEQQRPFATIEGYRADELVVAISDPKAYSASSSTVSPPDPVAVEIAFWESIKNSKDAGDFKTYLTRYPKGMFTEIARLRSDPAPTTSATPLPSAEELLADYFKALGGKEAIARLATLVRKGSYFVSQGSKKVEGEAELYEKRPDKAHLVIKVGGSVVSREVHNGTTSWVWDPRKGTQPAAAANLDSRQRSNAWDVGDVDEVKKRYSKLTVKERKKINEHDVFVVEATLLSGNAADRIYIDCDTKLVYRYDLITESVSVQSGIAFPTQVYMEDYVEISGVRIPMTIRQELSGISAIIKFDPLKLKFNVPLEDKLFGKP